MKGHEQNAAEQVHVRSRDRSGVDSSPLSSYTSCFSDK